VIGTANAGSNADAPRRRVFRGAAVPLRIALAAVALVEIGIGTYLTVEHYTGGAVACFAGLNGCVTVQHSRWSALVGVPVSLLGAIGAAFIIATTLIARAEGRAAALMLTLVGALFSAYLTGLEAWRIHAWCAWCVTSAVLWTLMLVLAVAAALRKPPTPA
jgi:uncharacterized membrane protein